MNLPAIQKLRQMLTADEPACGVWITLESPTVSEAAVAMGVDWLVVGHVEHREVLAVNPASDGLCVHRDAAGLTMPVRQSLSYRASRQARRGKRNKNIQY